MIDVKIKDGDTALDVSGRVVMLEGKDARFQRALISLSVPRGSFIYDRNLGTAGCGDNDAKKELVFNEALAAFGDAAVTGVDGSRVEIEIDGEKMSGEVRFYGEI